jgi:serine/threonine protein kinase
MLSTPQPAAPLKVGHTVFAETVAVPSSNAAHALAYDSNAATALAHDTVVSVGEVPAAMLTGARTTVLPRFSMNGAEAALVFEGRERFEHLRLLGEGGLGEVVGVLDHDIGRKVAIKRLRPEARSPAALARFVDEIRTIGKLEHPNIIPIHDVGLDPDGQLYFVMKYVDGETLETVIEKLEAGDAQYHKHYSFERRVEIFRALVEALAFAHDKGIIHRDIKPANVMIGRFGEVLLMDWGIAKSLLRNDAHGLPALGEGGAASSAGATGRAFETQLGSLVGTPLYMSPEQAVGAATDERSDVYSLCVLFYELLYLKHPLASKANLAQVLEGVRSEEFDTFRQSNPHQKSVPAELGYFLDRGLAKDPSKRHPSMRAMAERLDRRAEGDIPVECPITLMKSTALRSMKLIDARPMASMFLGMGSVMFFIALVVLAIRGLA